MTDPPLVAAFVPSMMDRSKAESGLKGAVFVASVRQLAMIDADVFVVDLMAEGVADALPELVDAAPVIGYAPHTSGRLAEAEALGVQALARSVFFRRLAAGELLA